MFLVKMLVYLTIEAVTYTCIQCYCPLVQILLDLVNSLTLRFDFELKSQYMY